MARWRALGDDLDPQVREFAALMRRRIERSGVSIAALADATGYSRSSWERYLNGRLLPPKYAVVALAQVTGTEPGHLTTMWELTERAWTRAEGRHDTTIQSHLVAEARAALGEFGPPPDLGGPERAPSGRGRRTLLFVTGVLVVVLAVVGATLLLGDRGSSPQRAGGASSSPSSSSSPSLQAQGDLPSGVKCGGARCTGQDPEVMGCGGKYARTAASTWVGGTYVEMRYSRTCGAVWARISAAVSGDTVTVTDGSVSERTDIGQDAAAYTPMLAVSAPGRAKACATLATGVRGCTPPGTGG
jgi:transcriptional regulator with XRE-family HTH domain